MASPCRTLITLLLALAGVLAFVATAAGATLTVDPHGVGGRCADGTPPAAVSAAHPLCTVGAAVGRLAIGGTVLLRAGAYTPATIARPAAGTSGWVDVRPWPGEASRITVDGLKLVGATRVRI